MRTDPGLTRFSDNYHNQASIRTDLNEYQFVSDQPIAYIDYLGGGVFCKCTFTPPAIREFTPIIVIKKGLIIEGGIYEPSETDVGTHTCTANNQGATFKVGLYTGCDFRTFSPPDFVCDCRVKECLFRQTYTCGKYSTGRKAGQPAWIFTSNKVVKDCHLRKQTGGKSK